MAFLLDTCIISELSSTALNGEWTDVSEMTDAERKAAGYQFFKVTVEMK